MRYRPYQFADFEPLYAIEEACFAPPLRFPRLYMRRILTAPGTAAWVAEDERGLAGFAVSSPKRTQGGPVAYIETIEVAPDRRKTGVGAELLSRIEASALEVGIYAVALHVDEQNATAIRLYEGAGYTQTGREANFYPDRRPALVYIKPLTSPRSSVR
jgi:ribosomal protein S18 acetylase RimI-like enzyme